MRGNWWEWVAASVLAFVLGFLSIFFLFDGPTFDSLFDERFILTAVLAAIFGLVVGVALPGAWPASVAASWAGALSAAIRAGTVNGAGVWAIGYPLLSLGGGYVGSRLRRLGRSGR
jgi:hypothetical protein